MAEKDLTLAAAQPVASAARAAYPDVPLEALELGQQFKATQAMLLHIVQAGEARLLELLWQIRRQFTDERKFFAFAEGYLDLEPARAKRMVTTWAGARKNRHARELASRDADQAMVFIQQLNGTDLGVVIEDDAEVARILSLSPKKQRDVIRDLLETKEAVDAGHHPADREYIKTLSAEKDAALAALDEATKIERLDNAPQRRLAQRRERLAELIQHFYDFVAESNAELAAIDFAALSEAELIPYQEALGHGRNEVLSLLDALDDGWRAHLYGEGR